MGRPHTAYLDCNASTPCDPEVAAIMVPLLTSTFANPSSRGHGPGQEAAALLDDARSRTARAIGAGAPSEITFTSGATEANNTALVGLAHRLAHRGRHLVAQVTEHPSVLEPLRRLRGQGWEITLLGVAADGRIRLQELQDALTPRTVLLTLMLANNETGALQPVREAAELARAHGVVVHCDAAQGPGKVAVDVAELGVDHLSLSAHKAYGPKGIGVLYSRRQRPPLRPEPLLLGGGQEGGQRSGTPNLPAAVGMARALELARERWWEDGRLMAGLRDRLEEHLQERLDGVTVNGPRDHRLPNTSNISFAGVDGNALLASLRDLAVSSGSACATGSPEPSSVLRAMGVAPALAAASIRVSLGRTTTSDELEWAAERMVAEVRRLRAMGKRGR